MRHVLMFLIAVYRAVLSPSLGTNCRFYPSCSCYAQQALQHHGAVRGLWLTIKRIARCHPWHVGGYDPVPQRSVNKPSTPHDHTGNCSHG